MSEPTPQPPQPLAYASPGVAPAVESPYALPITLYDNDLTVQTINCVSATTCVLIYAVLGANLFAWLFVPMVPVAAYGLWKRARATESRFAG